MIVSKFNILTQFGSGYTFSNLDDERYLNLMYIGKCIMAVNNKRERDRMTENGKRQVYQQ